MPRPTSNVARIHTSLDSANAEAAKHNEGRTAKSLFRAFTITLPKREAEKTVHVVGLSPVEAAYYGGELKIDGSRGSRTVTPEKFIGDMNADQLDAVIKLAQAKKRGLVKA